MNDKPKPKFMERLDSALKGAECMHCGVDTDMEPGFPISCSDCREQDAIDQHALKMEGEQL